MYTPSFFADPVFKDGAMTSLDPAVRAKGLENAKAAVDATVTLGAEVMVFWNGREGFDFVLAKNGQEAFRRLVDGFNAVGQYALERYGAGTVRFALEPKPNEPRANMYLANVGEVLYLISRLDPAVQTALRGQPGDGAQPDRRAWIICGTWRCAWKRVSCSTFISTRRTGSGTTRTCRSGTRSR